MGERIEDLLDFPSIQQLAGALWRQPSNGKGAAVLVGSGFSRNAERAAADTPEPPLWWHLLDEMKRRLYPQHSACATSDPLRLAEEFRAYFGQSALDDFIRSAIPDTSWYPGAAHKRLLELPWTEVLTTNWDTLLERASKKVLTHNYEIVRSAADLAHTRSPRVVKLHGTIGGSEPYIFAEEDYRTYPQRYAAMVNFARQVFIENELCLVGFSGDDPNFLQWSGWVRDHLANASRRIYLVGVLGLGPAARKLLESRNIAPIDLKPLVEGHPQHDQHAAATDCFLSFLEDSKRPSSYEWRAHVSTQDSLIPSSEVGLREKPEYVAEKLIDLIKHLKKERQDYPGWLVCPSASRKEITFQIPGIEEKLRIAKNSLKGEVTAAVAIELAWRYEISFGHLSKFAYDVIANVMADPGKFLLGKFENRLLAKVLLRHARELGDDEAFEKWEKLMFELGRFDQEAIDEAYYGRCLRYRDKGRFEQLESELVNIEGQDPVWQMRKTFLLLILRRWDEAESVISKALDDIRERSGDARDSLWLRSRRTWCQWLRYIATVKPGFYDRPDFSGENVFHCNPYEEIQAVRSSIHAEMRDQSASEAESFIPLFAAGTYRDNSDSIIFRAVPVASPSQSLMRLMETAGVPVYSHHFNLIEFFPEALALSKEESVRWYLQAAQYAKDEKSALTVTNLGRISIALLDQALVVSLKDSILSSINYWRNRVNASNTKEAESAVSPIIGLISLLYRLTPRLADDAVQECFKLGMELAKNRVFFRMSALEAISNLIKHAALSMSIGARSGVSLDAFEFPLASEQDVSHHGESWPDPFQDLKCYKLPDLRRVNPARWSIRVATLLRLATDSLHRPGAIMRLVQLSIKGELTPSELTTFGSAIWSLTDATTGLPSGTDLHPAVFTKLPYPSTVNQKALLKAYLFSSGVRVKRDIHWLLALGYAATEAWGSILPTSTQARKLLRSILPEAKDAMAKHGDDFGHFVSKKQMQEALGAMLANSILPALKDEVNDKLFDDIFDAITTAPIPLAISGLPYIVTKERSDVIEGIIQRSLFSNNHDYVVGAARGISTWVRLSKNKHHVAIPAKLVESLLLALEARQATGLAAILLCCYDLLRSNYFNKRSENRIKKAVGAIIIDYDYKNIEPRERRAVSASMVRVECVRLVRLMKLGVGDEQLIQWIEDVKYDPLAEVRHAAVGESDPDVD